MLQASRLFPLLFLISLARVLLVWRHSSVECFCSFILNVQLVSVKLHDLEHYDKLYIPGDNYG